MHVNSYTDLVLQARESLEARHALLHDVDQELLRTFGSPQRHAQLTAAWHKLKLQMIPEAETFLKHCLVQWAEEEWGPTERPATELGVPAEG